MTSVDELVNDRRRPNVWLPLACVAVFVGSLWSFASAGNGNGTDELLSLAGSTMGTQYHVRVVGKPSERSVEKLQQRIDSRLAEVNRRMSTYDPESEISRFNQSASTEWFSVSAETAGVVAYALELAKQTDGAYDPTVGPLVNLWGFGPTKKPWHVPTEQQIAEASEQVGYGQIEVRITPPALRKQHAEVYLDLSSVAKGHGVDVIAHLLEELGYTAYMVEIGGEVRTLGAKPNGKPDALKETAPWRIGILSPDSASKPITKILELKDASIATSGDYRNFFEHDGIRYSHTIDPRTGRPVTHRLASVTVASPICRDADAMATALLVLGSESGYDWAVEHNVAAYFLSRADGTADDPIPGDPSDQAPLVQTTPAWDNRFPVEADPTQTDPAETTLSLEPTL